MWLELQTFLVERYIGLVISLGNLDLKDWAGICTIGWILYQFIEKRRLSEANIDKFLGSHFTEKKQSIEDQRVVYLAHFDAIASSSAPRLFLRACVANVLRMLWLAWRVIRLDFKHTSASHAMLLFDSGRRDRAIEEFFKVSEDLLNTAKIYRQQASAKKKEAINALIYAGRVAALQNDTDTTIDAFNRALRLRDGDLDARKFVGEQFRRAGNLTAALEQFEQIVSSNAAKRDKRRAAEAYRLQAEVYCERGELGDARTALLKSLEIEKERQSYLGVADTAEMLGDTFAGSQHTLADARAAYELSLENYRTVEGQKKAIKRIRKKLRGLRSEETFLSKLAESLGTYFTETVATRLRAPAQTP